MLQNLNSLCTIIIFFLINYLNIKKKSCTSNIKIDLYNQNESNCCFFSIIRNKSERDDLILHSVNITQTKTSLFRLKF